MEMKDYVKIINGGSDYISIETTKTNYLYNSKVSTIRNEGYGRSVRFAILGLYKKYTESVEANQKKINTLKSFLDKYSYVMNGHLYFPETNSGNFSEFENSAKIVCSKFEEMYDCHPISQSNLDKELRKL